MRLVAKFAVAFFLVSCVGLVVYAWANARREEADLQQSVTEDLQAFGEGLREGIVTTWEIEGDAWASQVVTAANARRGDVEITWNPGPSTPLTTSPAPTGHMVSVVVPVKVKDALVGSIVLRRSIQDERALLRGSVSEDLEFAILLAVTSGGLVVLLGGVLIGSPLQHIVTQARRIGGGDLSQRLEPSGRDELADLSFELNTMCDQLVDARTRLEDESAARVETLVQLRHLDRLRTIGTLASSVAHELGTPLNVLLLRGESLAAGELSRDEVAAAGKTITSQVEKMSRIVRQILDFSHRAPTRGDVSLSEVARRAADLLGSVAKKVGVGIEVDVEREATVVGDFGQIEQAVTNLVVNGIQAMPKGGTLRLRVGVDDDARAANKLSRRAAFISVADEGVGISETELARIFEPFYTTKPAGSGTGLGLTVACGIAEDHGGWISGKSEPNRGSSFTLYIPVS